MHLYFQIFHGQLVNKTTCSKGHIQTDRDAPFWYLQLSLVDSCSVVRIWQDANLSACSVCQDMTAVRNCFDLTCFCQLQIYNIFRFSVNNNCFTFILSTFYKKHNTHFFHCVNCVTLYHFVTILVYIIYTSLLHKSNDFFVEEYWHDNSCSYSAIKMK